MNCSVCGTENPDGAKFCKGCGKAMEAAAQENQAPQSQQPVAAADALTPAAAPQAAQQMPATQAPAPQPQANASTTSDQIDMRQYVASPLDCGFSDVVHSKGWVKRSILLALCGLIPILDWVVAGFSARWGREVCVGSNKRLPMAIFDNRSFSTGAKIWFAGILWSILLAIAFVLCMYIPFVGVIIFVLLMVAYYIVSPLLTFQVGLTGRISSAFTGFGKAWRLFKKAPVATLAATIAPRCILSAILSGISGAFLFASALGFGGSLTKASLQFLSKATAKTSLSAAPANLLSALTGFIASCFVICLIIWLLWLFVHAVATVWTYRSIGHLIAQEAPEWMTTPGYMDYEMSRGEVIAEPFVPFRNTPYDITKTQ